MFTKKEDHRTTAKKCCIKSRTFNCHLLIHLTTSTTFKGIITLLAVTWINQFVLLEMIVEIHLREYHTRAHATAVNNLKVFEFIMNEYYIHKLMEKCSRKEHESVTFRPFGTNDRPINRRFMKKSSI